MPDPDEKFEAPASRDSENLPPPFSENCHARSLWSINEFAECLVPPPQNCGYALSHGDHHYCYHPRRQEIVIRTLKMIRGMAR